MSGGWREDLVVLVADKNIEHIFKGLLGRHQALAIRPITHTLLVHMHRDPGCLRAADFLRARQTVSQYALVVFDREGCGRSESREQLEQQIESELANTGWNDRAAVIVLDPEIECWVWTPSPHVDNALGWRDRQPSLRQWLKAQGFLTDHMPKPSRPKEALEAAVREVRLARSSSIYENIARTVSFARCVDPSFQKLHGVLVAWFGSTGANPCPEL